MERALRAKYKDREACQFSVGASIAGVGADALNVGWGKRLADATNGIALMRCVGMSRLRIVMHYLLLVALVVVCAVVPPMFVPARISNCKTCEARDDTAWAATAARRRRRRRRCVKWKDMSPEDCAKAVRTIAYVVGAVVGLVLVTVVQWLFVLWLKTRVFTTKAVASEALLRIVL